MVQTKQGVRVGRRPGWLAWPRASRTILRRVWSTSQTRARVASTI